MRRNMRGLIYKSSGKMIIKVTNISKKCKVCSTKKGSILKTKLLILVKPMLQLLPIPMKLKIAQINRNPNPTSMKRKTDSQLIFNQRIGLTTRETMTTLISQETMTTNFTNQVIKSI